MTIDSLGVIRRGWQEVATTVAPQVPALADLLEQRLGEAQRLHTLDEASLLGIVDAATQLAANSGAVEVAPTLSKRLRRHVYEYLLSLDAAVDSRMEQAPGEISVPDGGHPLIGTDEVDQLRGARPRLEGNGAGARDSAEPLIGADEVSSGGSGGPDADLVWVRASSLGSEPEFPMNGSFPEDGDSGRSALRSPDVEPFHDRDAEETGAARGSPPARFGFHIGDPDDMLAPPVLERDGNGTHDGLPELFHPLDPPHPPMPLAAPRRTAFGDPSTWPKPVVPQLRGGRGNGATPSHGGEEADSRVPSGSVHHHPAGSMEASVHPGAAEPFGGSMSVAEAPVSSPSPEPAAVAPDLRDAGPEEAGPMPSLPAPPVAEAPASAAPPVPAPAAPRSRPSDPVTDGAATSLPDPVPDARSEPASTPASAGPTTNLPSDPARELLSFSAVGAEAPPADLISEEELAGLRTSVEERLRKKRCDDAASLLQRTAQDVGGQAVASLALDAGDRCRALGKRNAALNCYLAASRADPVFEPPLARLADICIDDQDLDLAVSYLERIARLTRLRGDQRSALRIYRKIATIAPYRDDVLATLMRAEESGRID